MIAFANRFIFNTISMNISKKYYTKYKNLTNEDHQFTALEPHLNFSYKKVTQNLYG